MTTKNLTIDLDEDRENGLAGAIDTAVNEDALLPGRAVDANVVDEDVNPLDKLPPHDRTNSDGSVTLPLLYPRELLIRKAGVTRTDRYTELTFHRLNGADQRAIASSSEDMMTVIAFSRSTRISQAVMNALFDKMDGADIAAAGLVLNSFFATGRKTGR